MVLKKFDENWAESLSAGLLLIGFLISLLLTKAWLVYVVVFLSGFLGGRVFYIKRLKEPIFPFVLMIVGFLVGYLLGSFWASRFWVVMLFALGFAGSYYLHMKKILVEFRQEDFFR